MNPILTQMLTSRTVQTPDNRTLPLHSNIAQLEGELLHAWITSFQPKRILEIGLAYGVSALFICDALSHRTDVVYHIIDSYQHSGWQGCGIFNLNRAGYAGRYVLHEKLSESCLPYLLDTSHRFDFAFIDGFHTFDHALVDFFYINRMLDVGGVVVFDDVHLPSIQKILSYVASYPCYEPLSLPEEFQKHRVIRVRRMMNMPSTRIAGFVKTAVDERPWDWYHEF